VEFILHNLWYIVGAIVLILGGGTWWILSSGAMPRFLDMVNPAGDKRIKAKLFCEDKQIRDRNLKVETYCITDEKKMSAYHLVHELLLTGHSTGKQFLCLNERNSFPIDFSNQLTDEKRNQYPDAQRVYIDTANDIDSKATSDAAKNMMGMSLSIIAMAGALAFIVMAIIIFWKGGGI
jgi:hypothetical protein